MSKSIRTVEFTPGEVMVALYWYLTGDVDADPPASWWLSVRTEGGERRLSYTESLSMSWEEPDGNP